MKSKKEGKEGFLGEKKDEEGLLRGLQRCREVRKIRGKVDDFFEAF
jgi:hypothetical protein